MPIRFVAILLVSVSAGLAAQSVVYEKALGAITIRVTKNSGDALTVTTTSAAGVVVTPLPTTVDGVIDARVWNNQRLVLVGSRSQLHGLSIIDVASGAIVDSLFANFRYGQAPDGRRIAFDPGRSLAQSQSAVVLLYDLGRSSAQNHMPNVPPQTDEFGNAGIAVYPERNRIQQSSSFGSPEDIRHSLKSPLVWVTDDTLVFFDYSNDVLKAVVVEAQDITQPIIRTATVNAESLVNQRGRLDFADVPLAKLLLVSEIIPIEVRPNLLRIRVKMPPAYWQTNSEFEMEF